MVLPSLLSFSVLAQTDGPSTTSCSSVLVTGAVGSQSMVVSVNDLSNPGSTCINPLGLVSIPAGSIFTLACNQFSDAGTLAPNVMTIRLVIDNTGFGTSTPAAIRTIDAISCLGNAGSPDIFTAYCTSDGTSTGATRYGIIRVHLRLQQTAGVGGYDGTSDDSGTPPAGGDIAGIWGIIRCTTGLSILNESNPQTIYVAGDTIGTTITLNATPYDTTASGHWWVQCDTTVYRLTTDDFPTVTAKAKTTTVIGTLNVWLTTCTDLDFGFRFTRNSAVSGWTTTSWGVFSGTLPAATTLTDSDTNATFHSIKDLSRVVSTFGTCAPYHVNASGTVVTSFNRMEGVRSDCTWENARNVAVPNNRPIRAYYTRSTNPSTTDYPSTDILAGGGGAIEWTAQSVITATPSIFYHGAVQTYNAAGRTLPDLLSVGNISGMFTLSNIRHFTDIQLWKVSPGGTNSSSFTSGDDQLFVSARGLSNIRNEVLSTVNATCRRVFPNGGTESEVPMGNTDGSGNTAFNEFAVQPPLGEYDMICSSEAAGNIAHYTVTYVVSSAFTGNTQVVIETWRANNTLTIGVSIDSVTEMGLEENFFDDPENVQYSVKGRYDDGYPFYTIAEGLLTQAGDLPVWVTNTTLPNNGTKYIHIHAWGDFAGNTLLGVREVEQWNNTRLEGTFNGTFNGTYLNLTLDAGNFSGNFTGNFTGNVTFLDIMGTVILESALDQYLPILLYGGLLVFFLLINAPLPATASLMGLINSQLPAPIWPTVGSVFFLAITVILHVLFVKWGNIIAKWVKGDQKEES